MSELTPPPLVLHAEERAELQRAATTMGAWSVADALAVGPVRNPQEVWADCRIAAVDSIAGPRTMCPEAEAEMTELGLAMAHLSLLGVSTHRLIDLAVAGALAGELAAAAERAGQEEAS